MNFLYPQFLYALSALLIPILIHLFNFRKTKRVYFSNTSFLKKVKEASSSKRKLKHYLILASRLLLIFFLVMAFAQPYFPSESEEAAQGKAIIYLDNSLSMSNEVDEGKSAFDEGLGYINALTALYPTAAQYKILTNDFNSFSNVFRNKSEVSDLTTEMELTGITRSFDEVKNRLVQQMGDGEKFDVYWISDFQKATAGDDEIVFDSAFNVNIVPLGFTSVNNVYVDSLYLENPFLIGDEKLKLNVVLRNIGTAEASDLIVKIFVDEIQSATASIDIVPNDKVTVSFDLAFNIEGSNKCRISFEEFPVTFDNDFYFTIDGSRKINVLEIKSAKEATNIENVFGNEKLFDLKSSNIANLDYSLIPEADLVVVNSLTIIDPSLAAVLNKYLEEFGNLLVIPSISPDINSYKQVAGLTNITAADTAARSNLASPDFSNPFFENVFEETTQSFSMPEAAGVLAWGSDRTALIKYNNGLPFLSRFQRGGNIYLLAAPLHSDFTNFQSHAIFVPVMYRIAAESASKGSKLYYYTDDPRISFKTDTLVADNVFKLKRNAQEIIPTQRVSGNNVFMEVPRTAISAGFYDLTFEGRTLGTLAFNVSPEESDLRQFSAGEIKDRFKGRVDVFDVQNTDQFRSSIEKKYIGQPLWKYAIMLVLIFLLIETLFIRFLP